MKKSNYPPLKRQLQLFIILAVGFAVLTMGTIWLVYSQLSHEKHVKESYTIQADMIGSATKAAMMFADKKLALKLLKNLKRNPNITVIRLFTADEKLLLSFPDSNAPIGATIKGLSLYQNTIIENEHLKISRTVFHNQLPVGFIQIESDLAELKMLNRVDITTILLVMLGTLIFSFLIAQRLQRKLTASENMLRLAIKQAEDASDAKSEFLSTMSHELRTPLHGIIGLQELIAQDSEQLSQEQKDNLTLAQQSAKSLQALVNDILDLSKIEAGSMDILNNEFKLTHCICSALIPFVALAREKKITLSLCMENVPKTINSAESQLRQVLLNLIGNAVKFTHHGNVALYVTEKNGYLQFSIRDTGIGISREDLKQIFDPFVQVSRPAHLQQSGTGLGTSIAKRFVELMEGEIQAESELGKGSNFTFRIPCHAVGTKTISTTIDSTMDLYKATHTPAVKNPPTVQQSASRVLLAEDDPIGQRIAVKLLTKAGFSVDVAETGNIAWQKARHEKYDLILTDVRMPGIDGIELTKRIRQMERKNSQPAVMIIGLSAHALEEVATECIKAGMNRFMTKPVNPETILTAVLAGINIDNNSD
ncbi:MAG: response regulator [Mariprofundaceae bacterium]|nr:response regulator [Mariprofundaceae bacterium]